MLLMKYYFLIYTNLRDFKNSPLKSLSHRHFTPIKFHLRKAINQHKKQHFLSKIKLNYFKNFLSSKMLEFLTFKKRSLIKIYILNKYSNNAKMVAKEGFEPPSFGL